MTEHGIGGKMDGHVHRFPVRVYYEDTDAGGIVYHSNYLNFAERARTEMMRGFGLDHLRLKAGSNILFAVRSCELDFRRSARLEDLLELRSTLVHLGGASLHFAQSVWRGDEELVRLVVRLVCMTFDGKAARIPLSLRENLQDFLTQEAD